MSQLPLFSSGLELATLVVNSGLLQISLSAICELQWELNPYEHHQEQSLALRCKLQRHQNHTVIAFTSPGCTIHHLQQGGELVSSITLKQENFNHFEFLCFKGSPSFHVNRAAITLFYQHLDDFSYLKSQFVDSTTGKLLVDTPLIVTGNSLGGSVASLFTLWLLDSINPSSKYKRPLCITFGSPLLGDSSLQRAISQRSMWNSRFLNVAARHDLVPRLFIHPSLASTPRPLVYMPFGTFLLCSECGCACVEDPEQIAGLLQIMGLESATSQVSDGQFLAYYRVVENLKARVMLKGTSLFGPSVTDSFQAGIFLQVEAIGDPRIQPQGHDMGIANLIIKLEGREKFRLLNERRTMDPKRKLNEVKVKMTFLEWYKKSCKAKQTGYYDSYKSLLSASDRDITRLKKYLTIYWKGMVAEAENKPYKEGSFFELAWLYAGTNYRRMVEPLDIAEYYRKNGKRNYKENGRSKHYILLEKWQNEDIKKSIDRPTDKKKRNVDGNLTEDSCFWAHVEEALISCELMKDPTSSDIDKQSSMEYLNQFQTYLMDQIRNYAVSPHIFLRDSSFMKWWRQFQDNASDSSLVDFMNDEKYVQYENGCF